MKYKTKIVPENGKYIGYVFLDENIVYTSNVLGDPIAISRELAKYITTNGKPLATTNSQVVKMNSPASTSITDNVLIPVQNNVRSPNIQQPNQSPPNPANTTIQRKCCGRS